MQYLGDFPEDATVYIPFNTFSSDDPSASVTITNLVDADIKVHKDGSTTDIVTDGATVAIDFDTVTGNHLITIDTSASADYSIGSDYLVRIEGTTVDAGTINAIVGSFSIENRFNEVDVVKWLGTAAATPTTAGIPEVDVTHVSGVAEDIATETKQNTAQSDLDIITGADGAALASTQQSITFQPIVITAGDAINNITLAGTGTSDGIAFTRSGSGDPFDANIMAQINAEVDTALSDYDAATGTELAAIDVLIDAIKAVTDLLPDNGALTTLIAHLTDIKGGTFSGATDSLEAIRDRGDAAWITATGFATEAKQDIIDTVVDAIKVKTDSLTFTKANELDSNTQSINDVTITGNGSTVPYDV